MATLTIQLPGLPPVSHILRDETITVGRMRGNTIVVEDSSVSLWHAKITRVNGEYYLKDLNSTNGTAVNGQFVSEAKLRDQDRVKFADITGQFHAEAETAAVPAPAVNVPGSSATPSPATSVVSKPAPAPVAVPPPTPASAPRAPVSARAGSAAPSAAPVSSELQRLKVGPRLMPYVAGFVGLIGVGIIAWTFLHPAAPARAPEHPVVTAPSASQKATPPPSSPPIVAPKPVILQPAAPANSETDKNANLVRQLKNPDPLIRRQAARLLHSQGADAHEAVPALRDSLKDADAEVQMWAALALVNNKSYDKGAIPILVRTLQNENATLRQVACLSLGIIPYDGTEKTQVVPALTEVAQKDSDEEVRKAAASALSIVAPESPTQPGTP